MINKNKFLARPNIPHHDVMPGVDTHPGFHTSDDVNNACYYALTRCDKYLDSLHEINQNIYYVYDYLVIAIMDMRGLKKHLDYDADVTVRNIFEDNIKCIVDEYPGIEKFSDNKIMNILRKEAESYNHLDFQSADNSIDAYAISIFNPMISPLMNFMEYSWAADIIRKYAETKTIPDWVLMLITGQYRYTEDVDENRIIGIYYITPLSPYVFEDTKESEEEEKKWPGFDCPYINDIIHGLYDPQKTLVYGYDVLNEDQIDIFGYEPKLEYHGTILSLFKKAAPEIAKKLPEPPCPPYKPERMTKKEYFNRVKIYRKGEI
jgi:hypothetical protein